MLFSEFRRRFEILVPPEARPNSSITDEKQAVEKLLTHIDLDKPSYRLGLSQVSATYSVIFNYGHLFLFFNVRFPACLYVYHSLQNTVYTQGWDKQTCFCITEKNMFCMTTLPGKLGYQIRLCFIWQSLSGVPGIR